MTDDNHNTTPVASEVESSRVGERPLLVGRDRELSQIEAILKHGRPALVVVSAATGMGKTSLLREVHERTIKQGWHTAYSDSEGGLSVVPTTTEETFRQRVLTLLDISTEESYFDTLTSQSQPSSLHSLPEHLRRWAPILLIIDGYRPAPDFANWFTTSFIENVTHAGAPLVVVVADQGGNVDGLLPFADKIITLGPLDPRSVKQHFESVGRQIAPPMKEAELDIYVKAACKDPARLVALTRVLMLAQPGEVSTPSSLSTPRQER
jgi:hypothetical protein